MVYEILLGISLFANICLVALSLLLRQKIQQKTDESNKTQDALDVLSDLRLYGRSLVRIERVDASDIFLKGTK